MSTRTAAYFLLLGVFLFTLIFPVSTIIAHPDAEGGAGHEHEDDSNAPEITPADADIVFQSVMSIADAISEQNYDKVLDFVVQEDYQLRQSIASKLEQNRVDDYHFNTLFYDIVVDEDKALRANMEFIASGPGWKETGYAIFAFNRAGSSPALTSTSPNEATGGERWLIVDTDFHLKFPDKTTTALLVHLSPYIIAFTALYILLLVLSISYVFRNQQHQVLLWVTIMSNIPIIGLVWYWSSRLSTLLKNIKITH